MEGGGPRIWMERVQSPAGRSAPGKMTSHAAKRIDVDDVDADIGHRRGINDVRSFHGEGHFIIGGY